MPHCQALTRWLAQAFEEFTQRLEDNLNKTPHYAAILDKCYRELMILGFISLTVVFANVRGKTMPVSGTPCSCLLTFACAAGVSLGGQTGRNS